MAKRTYYMHMVNGLPAGYEPRMDYLWCATPRTDLKTSQMAKTLQELRKQQKVVRPPRDDEIYSYLRIVVDA